MAADGSNHHRIIRAPRGVLINSAFTESANTVIGFEEHFRSLRRVYEFVGKPEHAQFRLRPGLPVLFASGYTENAMVHHGRLDPGVQLLAKPYRQAELARRVRQAMAGARGADD